MERMLGRSRPFYKAGPVMRLQKIPADGSRSSSRRASRRTGIKPAAGLGAAIVELAGNLPYDVQRLAHEVWDDARSERRRTADLDDLHATLHAAARRARDAVREHVAAADARAARRAAGGGARGRPRAALGRRPRPLPAERHVDRPGVARRAACARTCSPAKATATSSSTRCSANGSRRRRWTVLGMSASARSSSGSGPAGSNMTALLDRLGLGRRDLRAWAMYDWANSAFQTTIIAAVFPIYFHKVAAADLPPARGHQPIRLGDHHRHPDRRDRRAAARRDRRLRRGQEEAAGGVRRHRRDRHARDVLDRARRLAARAGAVRHRQRRRGRQHRVLRVAAAAPGRARRSSIGCRRPATRSATSAAACCWRSTC